MNAIPANNGWTCSHVANTSGPCGQCVSPTSGICPKCRRPIDDHDHIGLEVPECWKVRR